MARISGILLTVLLLCLAGESFAAKLDQFVDPMRPVRYQASSSTQEAEAEADEVDVKAWKLSAVLISTERCVAVINGKSLQEGELLDGYRIIQIRPDKVLLKNKQRKLVLRRAGTGLKKISPGRDVGKGSKS